MSYIEKYSKQSSFIVETIEFNEYMSKQQVNDALIEIFNYDLFQIDGEIYQTKDIKKILVTESFEDFPDNIKCMDIKMCVCIYVSEYIPNFYFDGNVDEVVQFKVYKKIKGND